MFNMYTVNLKGDRIGPGRSQSRLGKEGVHLVPSFGGNTASVSLHKQASYLDQTVSMEG